MTIASKLETINEALGDIKSSIVAKGVTPTGDITTYSTAIDDISGGGDEITATNKTGSAISTDDKVWVNGEDVYMPDFTAYGSPTITNKVITLDSGSKYTYKDLSSLSKNLNDVELGIKIKFTRSIPSTSFVTRFVQISLNDTNNRAFIALYDGYGDYGIMGSVGLKTDASSLMVVAPPTNSDFYNFATGSYMWLKLVVHSGLFELFGSTNGVDYISLGNAQYASSLQLSTITDVQITGNSSLSTDIDLSECYVKAGGNIVWTPYTKTGINYSIINDTDITSTSFTGVAQANIANNATGSVKTLLDGNGTYAPTTATKSITTNGTYTASAENAYGLSEVTVNVPTPDTWYNWKNTEYTPDFSNMNSYGTVSDGIYTLTPRVPNPKEGGVCKTLDNAFNYSSDFEVVIKVKISNLIQNDQTRSIFYLGADGNSFYNSLSNTLKFCTQGNTVNNFGWFLYNTLIIQGSDSFSNMTNDTWYWFKLTYNATSNILTTYQSVDGITYTQIATASYTLPSSSVGTYILLGLSEFNSTTAYTGYVDLRASYVKSGDDIVWTPYTESSSQCYTLTASPTTSTQVYEIPKKTSTLTITSVGTGTITLSDSKVYNRNSAGDVESPVLGTKTITSNDTYTAASDYLDGFSSVTVDVPSAPTKKYNLLDRVKADNNNEIGTVSGFFTDANNVEYAVVCLDAQYRLESVNYCSNKTNVITNLPIYDDTTWGPWEAKETATFNTQKILDYCTAGGYTSTACSHCRSKSFVIDNTTYYGQLPNMIELNDIMRNHTAIDTADPTASLLPEVDFSTVRLSSPKYWWSSSQFSRNLAWLTEQGGSIYYDDKNDGYYVAPVLEIPNT